MDIPKHYRLKGEEKDHFVLHDSRDKTDFKVSKKDLHPAHQIKVMKVQKFSEPGEVEEPETETVTVPDEQAPMSSPEQNSPQGMPMLADMGAMANPAPMQTPAWTAPMLPPGEAPAPTQSAEQPIAAQAKSPPPNDFSGLPGFSQMAEGLQSGAGAQQQMAKDQQRALENDQAERAAHQMVYEQRRQALDAEQDELKKSIANNRVDPDRYFKEMGTGKRIATAIGMILGGIGSGLSGRENMAMKVLNKAVDDDINAQKENLGNTKSLLNLNLQKYNNLESAEAATRLHYNTILQTKLQAAQARATSGQAQGQLQLGLGQLEHQAGIFKQTIALNQAKAQGLGVGGTEGGIPINQEPPMLLMDPKYAARRVVVDGRAYQARDSAAATKLAKAESIAGPVKNQIGDLQQLSLDPSTRVAGTPANLQAHSIMGNLAVQLPQLSGLNRVTEVEIKHLLETFQNPTRMDESLGRVKNTQFLKNLEDDLQSKRSTDLIGYKGMNAVKSFAPATGQAGKLPFNK